MSVIVYGVTKVDHPEPEPAPVGLGEPGGPVHLVRLGPLAAAVSATARLGVLGEQEAMRHVDILRLLLEAGPVLPMRLGTVAPDEESVRNEVLAPVGDMLPERLDAIDGVVELRVEAEEDERSALAAVLPGSALAGTTIPADLDSRIRLGERVADLVVARRIAQAEDVLALLRPLARADRSRRRHGGPEDPVLSWAFMVATEDVAEFGAALRRARVAHPELVIEQVGPLPAVSFVDLPPELGGRVAQDDPQAGWTGRPGEAAGDTFAGTGRWGWGDPTNRTDQGKGEES
ncbi:Gas vesicle synthesis protein GvpL/GvpF [Frankia canadensis]|uniref:Gas vesicle synthesis protein GvpL/GvpF n=1 Tax=Frankia canadensis TaxID=1836972 RepID=A0A2I2KNA5_9ACTN|nr:GvpL/GvpF family gas vesicle protein [Frankia canadensis]SNQ47136.1 Gas vesicle synthesis protein GvpL/GvpF [Frankia canadensis]SOU54426.1 Gas vesicle synthesis protein GvpL/GvpF [Frankia canadensis]